MKLAHPAHPIAGVLATLVAVACATGCSAPTKPEPTPTALVFATDEEAYAAAEEVYRAYVDAYNDLEYSDPDAYQQVETYLAGGYASGERKGLSADYADGITKTGEFKTLWVRGVERTVEDEVTVIACDDISEVIRLNADGTSRIRHDRPDTSALKVTLIPVAGALRISSAELIPEPECTR